ncbi:hypothetical protein DCAR_0623322 [Daucus carota subsp. sativus]|uniref:Uncharacterized protein n=1 Tax=Daucus carota subsp. sativus TaxID=79200 RepID=A0AAF1B295_DAUCS|nr:hypothetical protein DCAR_0623322 [Daucus carota subsp. sativus]
MKTPDRPDFPKCPPPAPLLLFLSESGFFNKTPTETKAKGESRRWTYRTEIRSHINILIH